MCSPFTHNRATVEHVKGGKRGAGVKAMRPSRRGTAMTMPPRAGLQGIAACDEQTRCPALNLVQNYKTQEEHDGRVRDGKKGNDRGSAPRARSVLALAGIDRRIEH